MAAPPSSSPPVKVNISTETPHSDWETLSSASGPEWELSPPRKCEIIIGKYHNGRNVNGSEAPLPPHLDWRTGNRLLNL